VEPLVSCLTSTYGRYSVLREAVSCFLQQDYENKELIIFNNHHVPLNINFPNVRVINDDPLLPTLGDCRNRLLEFALGDYVRTWDDDDLYLPWAIRQGVECIGEYSGFKPKYSWSSRKNKFYTLDENVFEASWTVKAEVAKKYGYKSSGGDEHITLDRGVVESGGFLIKNVRPSYVYRWDSNLHRISGMLGQPVDMQHKAYMDANQDHGNNQPITEVDLTHYWKAVEDAEKTVPNNWANK